MHLSDVFRNLGEDRFTQLLRGVSIGKLKTYQLYERLKFRLHIAKLNTESLRKAAPRLWERVATKDEEYATDLAQAVLVSHLDLVIAVLKFLGVPNEEGFFVKDLDPAPYLTEGWRERVYDEFKDRYPEPLVLFYINHLVFELQKSAEPFLP
ncbi:MAG: hypothetical protein M3Z09_05835 [Acidobacteriota bacterium]|nr:hypothetical protein [Acidobacteriota bacterium]